MSNPTRKPIPSKDPADQNTMAGMLRAVFKKQMQGVDGQLPAQVISYNRVTNRAVVQPMIAILGTDGSTVARASLASIPVLSLGGGGYTLNFPLKKGDLGWIEASDRDISLYLQAAGGQAQPNTTRLHSFSDGRFIPDAFAKYVINGEDANAVVLQSLDGTVRVAIDSVSGQVRVRAPTNIDLTSPTITLNASESIAMTTPLLDLTNVGTMSGGSDFELDGIKFSTHRHANGTLPSGESDIPKNP